MAFITFSIWLDSTIILVSFISIYIYFYLKHVHTFWSKKGIPFLEPVFLFGNVKSIFLGKDSIGGCVASIYQELKAKGAKYGGYYTFIQPVFIAIDPELVKIITIKEFNKFRERGTHYDEEVDPLSAHLFSLRNPKWYELRMKFSPMFTNVKLKNMFSTMVNSSKDLETILDQAAKTSAPIDIKEILARFTTDVIGSCAFGIKCNSLRDPDAEMRKVGIEFFRDSWRNSIVISLALTAPIILKKLKIPICNPKVAKYFLDACKDTIEYREKNNIQRKDMMNLLIKLKNNEAIGDDENVQNTNSGISFNDLAAQAFVFYLAGFETSATTMNFTLYELTINEDIQEKLRNEIVTVLAKHSDELSYDAIMDMTYLDKVIQETLRKYPPLPVLNRESTQDFEIPGTNIVLEKGTNVVLSSLGMHRDPEFYRDPETYDPERFNEERKSEINPNTYMPFGLGPRNCIGLKFGLLQTKIGLTVLLKNYKFTLHPDKKVPKSFNTQSFILAFQDMLWLKATKI